MLFRSSDFFFTPLHITAKENKVDIIKELLAAKTIDTNRVDKCGRTPLYIAVKYGHLETVKLLISAEKAVDPNISADNGYTALHLAVKSNNLDIFYELLALKDIDVDCRASNIDSPLYIACIRGNLKMVKSLLEKNADVFREFGFLRCDNFYNLHQLAKMGHTKIVRVLLRHMESIYKIVT